MPLAASGLRITSDTTVRDGVICALYSVLNRLSQIDQESLQFLPSLSLNPFRDSQSVSTRWLPGHAAFGDPRERTIFAVAKWGTVQRRVARHHGLDSNSVVGVDSLLKLPDLLKGLDVSFELRSARKPIETRDLELRFRDRCSRSGLEQVFGLVL
jgi:hypothetical protein